MTYSYKKFIKKETYLLNTWNSKTKLPSSFWQLLLPTSLISFSDILRITALTWMLIGSVSNYALLSILLTTNALAKVISPLCFSSILSKKSGRIIIITCLIFSTIATASCWLAVVNNIYNLLPLLEFIISASNIGFVILRQTLLRGELLDNQKETAAGHLRLCTYLSRIIAPTIAGSLLIITRPSTIISICIALSITALTITIFIKKNIFNTLSQKATRLNLRLATLALLEIYKNNPAARSGFIFFILTNLALSPIGAIIPAFVKSIFLLGPFELGVAETAIGLGAVFGAISSIKFSYFNLAKANQLLIVIFIIIFASGLFGQKGYYIFISAIFATGWHIAHFGSKIDALLMKSISIEMYPKTIGIQSLFAGLAYPIGLAFSSSLFLHNGFVLFLPLYSAAVLIIGISILKDKKHQAQQQLE